jgi:pimeloyl-ACP methyl ester carboxylesterase
MWADDIAGLMNAIGWEKAHINGTSFGGTIALAIGIRHPDRCLSVIANSCLARPDKTSEQRYDAFIRYAEEVGMGRELLAKLGGYGGEANYLETHADLVKKSLAMAAGTPLETWVAANRALKKVDLSQGLPLCSVATLVIAGDQDNTTPLDLQPPGLGTRQIVALLPNAALIVFKGAGHPTIFERPAQHARQTVEFVNAVREFRVVE